MLILIFSLFSSLRFTNESKNTEITNETQATNQKDSKEGETPQSEDTETGKNYIYI